MPTCERFFFDGVVSTDPAIDELFPLLSGMSEDTGEVVGVTGEAGIVEIAAELKAGAVAMV